MSSASVASKGASINNSSSTLVVEEQIKLLDDALNIVKHQSLGMKRCLVIKQAYIKPFL
jgi:hypothetical protein